MSNVERTAASAPSGRALTIGTPPPAAMFDAVLRPAGESDLAALGFEVVARPGAPAACQPRPGDYLVRRALGEWRLAVLSTVETAPATRSSFEARGVMCEGRSDGLFVEVSRRYGNHGVRVAQRIANDDGITPGDTLLLRPAASGPAEDDLDDDEPRGQPPTWLGVLPEPFPLAPEPEPGPEPARAPASPAAPAQPAAPAPVDLGAPLALLLVAVLRFRLRRRFPLPEDFVRALFEAPAGTPPPPLRGELERAAARLTRRLSRQPGPPTREAIPAALLDEGARELLSRAERRFVLDPARSTLELLAPAGRDRFLRTGWHPDDFPGGPRGPQEARAEEMFAALTALRPERRPNLGDTAVVRADEADAAMQRRIVAALAAVPGTGGLRLNGDAADAFVAMRSAAAAAGVTLTIGNGYRTPERARANAERTENRAAVASFSSHSLGLAIDLVMSQGDLRFQETTRPFQSLVDLYRSPVHKWMFLFGEGHGFYPYRREPWHWEFNPPGFRERFRRRPAPVAAPAVPPASAARPATEGVAEAAGDPVRPIRAPLAIGNSVGRAGRNLVADVQAVQDRLVELRELDAADAAAERPGTGLTTTPDEAIPRTIAAIEQFQRERASTASGMVEATGGTRLDLDRAIPRPSAADYAAAAAQRATINQTVARGLTLGGPVGAGATGNAPADVLAVQRRLVALGKLSPAHAEAPRAGAAAAVPPAALAATIAAVRATQPAVRFWLARGVVAGTVTPGVVAPGDASAALLDLISVYETSSGAAKLTFHDHVASESTRDPGGIAYPGIALPDDLAFTKVGLNKSQAAALRRVSASEGNFDAINTYDRATVSVGFIQFAGGGRGLAPYLGLLKARQPVKFRELFQRYGVDIEVGVGPGGAIDGARVLVLDPAASRVLRDGAAEKAIRDDKRLTAVFALSGRDVDVQRVQIEAAVRNYVLPVLSGRIGWGAAPVRLDQVLRSRAGLAALFDRAIQEGVGQARLRFERVIRALNDRRADAPKSSPLSLSDLQLREGDVLAELERDLQAAAAASASIARARAALSAVIAAARAPDATVAAIRARPELSDARRAVSDARADLESVVNVSPTPGRTADATLSAIKAALASQDASLALAAAPASNEILATTLTAARDALATISGPLATAPLFLIRVRAIRRSTLDASLTESDEPPNVPRKFPGWVRWEQFMAADHMSRGHELF